VRSPWTGSCCPAASSDSASRPSRGIGRDPRPRRSTSRTCLVTTRSPTGFSIRGPPDARTGLHRRADRRVDRWRRRRQGRRWASMLMVGPGGTAELRLDVPPGANQAVFTFDLIGGDSLDSETATMMINGQPVLRHRQLTVRSRSPMPTCRASPSNERQFAGHATGRPGHVEQAGRLRHNCQHHASTIPEPA
jgi:hypothetical protein